MLFYVTLFLLCFAVSTMVLLVFGALSALRKGGQRAMLPNHKGVQEEAPERQLETNIDTLATPWGWSGSRAPRRGMLLDPEPVIVPPAAKPNHEARNIGWPYRAEPNGDPDRPGMPDLGLLTLGLDRLAGMSRAPRPTNAERRYRLTRKSAAGNQGSHRSIVKPWGW
jgi:hypothetical protein